MIFPKLITVGLGILLFLGIQVSTVQASISEEESKNILTEQGVETSDANVKAYRQSINVGMDNQQAMYNMDKAGRLTQGSEPILGRTDEGQWSYVGDTLVFVPHESYISAVPEKNRNFDYTNRRAKEIEEVLDEGEYGYDARDYNDAFHEFKQKLEGSELSGTSVGDLMLRAYREAPNPNRRNFLNVVEHEVDSMEDAIKYGLFDKIAQIAKDNNVDLDDIAGYSSSLKIPGGYSVEIQTKDGKTYPPPTPTPTTPNQPTVQPTTSAQNPNPPGNQTNQQSNPIINTGNTTTPAAAKGLVPCGTKANPEPCTICHFAEGIHGIVQFIVKLIAILGIVIITISGVMYIVSAGNPQMTSLAKSAMKNALIGVIVVLTSFLIITFIINKVFDNSNSKVKLTDNNVTGMASDTWNFNWDCSP